MKIIAAISICFFLYCLISRKFTVKINDKPMDSLPARIVGAFVVSVFLFAILTALTSPLLLLGAIF